MYLYINFRQAKCRHPQSLMKSQANRVRQDFRPECCLPSQAASLKSKLNLKTKERQNVSVPKVFEAKKDF